MFNVEEIYGINISGEIKSIEEINGKILLVPSLIDDIKAKINKLTFDLPLDKISPFINGYTHVIGSSIYITRKGKLVDLQDKGVGKIYDFSNDIALGLVEKEDEIEACGIHGKTGEIFFFSEELGSDVVYSHYSCGLMLVLAAFNNEGKNEKRYYYINDLGKIASKELYQYASDFYDNKAIVKTIDGVWKMIDNNFNTITIFKDPKFQEMGQELIKIFNSNKFQKNQDAINILGVGGKVIMEDLDTGFNIRVYEVMEKIASMLKIDIKELDVTTQLSDLITKASQYGTFLMDLETMRIRLIEVRRGIRITDDSGHSIESFDKEDKEMVRSRIKDYSI